MSDVKRYWLSTDGMREARGAPGDIQGAWVRAEDYDRLAPYAELIAGAGYKLTARLAQMAPGYEAGETEFLNREAVMDAVMDWRKAVDAANAKSPQPSRPETGDKCQGTPPCPRCLVVQTITNVDGLRIDTETVRKCVHQSCAKSPTPRTDEAVARGMRDPDNWASLARELEARTEFQVGRDVQPFDYEATVRAFHAWLDSRPAGFSGEDVVNPGGRWFDAFVAGARSQSVACTKQEGGK